MAAGKQYPQQAALEQHQTASNCRETQQAVIIIIIIIIMLPIKP
jgi:hypothetical protein